MRVHLETVAEIAAVIPPFKDLFLATYADVDVIRHVSVFVSTWTRRHVLTCLLIYIQLSKVIKQARSDDSGKVKIHIIDSLPTIEGVPTIDHKLPKHHSRSTLMSRVLGHTTVAYHCTASGKPLMPARYS